jgi:hypothetical protein
MRIPILAAPIERGVSSMKITDGVIIAQLSCDQCLQMVSQLGSIVCADFCGGGSGNGTSSCCPPGTTCRCGGECINGKCVDGYCLRPNQRCP